MVGPTKQDPEKPRFGPNQPSHYCGRKGASGPPVGNLNAAKNGSRLRTKRLVVGELPKQLLSVKRETRAYRRAIEDAVVAVRGEVTVTDAHAIDTASAATAHAGICRWLLRNKIDEMKTSDVLSCSSSIVKAKQARDQAIKSLGLDVSPEPQTLNGYLHEKANENADA